MARSSVVRRARARRMRERAAGESGRRRGHTRFRPFPRVRRTEPFGLVAAYPAGPYGSERGSIIADHSFLGWRDPVRSGFDETRLGEVRFSDFYGSARQLERSSSS